MERIRTGEGAGAQEYERAAQIIRAGGVVAYPTDTLYGLGCNPLIAPALNRIYAIKGPEHKGPFIVLLDSATSLDRWCERIPAGATELIARWPAPLSIVLEARPGLPAKLLRGGSTLAFRVPDSALCRKIVRAAGGALVSTSVNRAGQKPLSDPEQIARRFGAQIDALLDAGPLPASAPSTVIRCVEGEIEILRRGAFEL